MALHGVRRIARYELSDYEWTAIKRMLPNRPCGVRRVNSRRARFFDKIKQCRRAATRYDKIGANYPAFVKLASSSRAHDFEIPAISALSKPSGSVICGAWPNSGNSMSLAPGMALAAALPSSG